MRDLSERIQRKHKGAGHKILGHWGTGKIIREIKSPSQDDSAHPCFPICRLVYLLFQEYKLNTSRYIIQELCWVFYAYSRNQFSIILSILDSSPLIRHFNTVVYRAQSSHDPPAFVPLVTSSGLIAVNSTYVSSTCSVYLLWTPDSYTQFHLTSRYGFLLLLFFYIFLRK